MIRTISLSCSEGRNTFTWDLKDGNGAVVKQDCYVIEITATLSDETTCDDEYQVYVIECGELQVRNARAKQRLDRICQNVRMTPRARSRSCMLATYRGMLQTVRKCICDKMRAQLVQGMNDWDDPCFIACITANLAADIELEFSPPQGGNQPGRVWAMAHHSAQFIPPQVNALGLAFLKGVIRIENKIRAKAMHKCCSCRYTPRDKTTLISCIVPIVAPRIPSFAFWLNATDIVREELDKTEQICRGITDAKPDCPIPALM